MTSFTCPQCTRTSHHPEDVRNGYCGHCHAYWPLHATPAADIIEQIDNAIGCFQCGASLEHSPSDDFCTQRCQSLWQSSRTDPLVGYQEPVDLPVHVANQVEMTSPEVTPARSWRMPIATDPAGDPVFLPQLQVTVDLSGVSEVFERMRLGFEAMANALHDAPPLGILSGLAEEPPDPVRPGG